MGIGVYLAIAACVLAALYVFTYYRSPSQVEIQQTTLADFTFDVLREKQPLVIDDRVKSLEDLRRLWFASNLTTEFRLEGTETWHTNRFKFLVMHAEQEGDIYVYAPGKKMIEGGVPDPEEPLVAIHLLPQQVVLLPFRWRYLVMPPMRVACLGVHDYVTYMLP
jgi:hypothetical protein